MARYTKKDADGRYYIESVNGKLESNVFGHTYGEAIDRFAELETADVVPKSEVEELKSDLEGYKHLDKIVTTALNILTDDIRQKVAREIFDDLQDLLIMRIGVNQAIAELKKKYIGEKR